MRSINIENRKFWKRVLIPAITFLLFTNVLSAQFPTVNFNFNPQPQSDYFLQTSWVATGFNQPCDCDFYPEVSFRQGPLGTFGTSIYHTETSNAYGNWTGSVQLPIGPGQSEIFANIYYANDSEDADQFFGCLPQITCGNTYYQSNQPAAGITLSTTPLKGVSNLSATSNEAGEISFTWDVETDIPESMYELIFYPVTINGVAAPWISSAYTTNSKSDVSTTIAGYTDDNTGNFVKFQPGDVVEFQVTTTYDGSVSAHVMYTVTIDSPDGLISGTITNLGGQTVQGVTVTAVLQNPGAITPYGNEINTTYTDVTDANGNYDFTNLYYGLDGIGNPAAQYLITPSLNSRTFLPTDELHDLSWANPGNTNVVNGVDFVDQTSYPIVGNVSDIAACAMDNITVNIFDAGLPVPNSQVTTDASGSFATSVDNTGTFDVIMFNSDLSWADTIAVIINPDPTIQNDIGNVTYTLVDTLSGFIGAGCNEYLGASTINALSTLSCGNPIATATTNSIGYYEMLVPRRDFTLDLASFAPEPGSSLNPIDVEAAFVQQLSELGTVSALDASLDYDIIYRKPLQILYDGLPAPLCSAHAYSTLTQGKSYNINFQVWEEPLICALDQGYIVITNFIDVVADVDPNPRVDTVFITNGMASYTVRPGDINLFDPNVSIAPLPKMIDMEFFNGAVTAAASPVSTESFGVYVEGVKLNGSSFVTEPADLPLGILRDPPGDESYSYLSVDTTISFATRFSVMAEQSVGAYVTMKAEADAGPIIPIKAWASSTFGLEVNATQEFNDETIVTVSSSNSFSTSGTYVDGAGDGNGDVYIGAAMNFIFAVGQEVYFDDSVCEFKIETTSSLNPNGIGTVYAYSQKHVTENVIPNLNFNIVNAANTNQGKKDKVRFESAKLMWEQIIQLNENLKDAALSGPTQNYSYDALATRTIEETSNSTSNRSVDFSLVIGASVAAEAGVEAFGIGVVGNVEAKFKMGIGGSINRSTSTTSTVGTYFADDDPGDFFSINYAPDPVYGTLCYELIAGETSCPYEAPTARLDDFTIQMQPGFTSSVTVPGNQTRAIFPIDISNIGQTTPDPLSANNPDQRDYRLYIVPTSHTGAIASVGGTQTGNPSLAVELSDIPQNGNSQVEIWVDLQNPTSTYTFQDVEVRVFAECDPDYYKSIFLSAYFDSPCSSVEFFTGYPDDNWLINSNDNNSMLVNMYNYDYNSTINSISLQMADAGTSSWSTVSGFPVHDNIGANTPLSSGVNGTTATWDVSNIDDGEYDIRWKLNCPGSFTFSTERTGIIDRLAPLVVGIPYPQGNNYTPTSEISVRFNEDIDCSSLSSSSVKLRVLPSNTIVPSSFTCNGDEIIITPTSDISGNIGTGYKAIANNVADIYGNANGNYSWVFTVGDEDSDLDGIGDSQDICPGGDDNQDTDFDGIPDACDCFPESDANAIAGFDCNACFTDTNTVMYFDGINDKIELVPYPNIQDNFTYEFWTKPDETIPSGLTEASTGVGAFVQSGVELPLTVFPISGGAISSIGIAVGTNGIMLVQHAANLAPNTLVHYSPIESWTHVAVSVANGMVKLYVNGIFIKENPYNTAYPVQANFILGGNQNIQNFHFFRGQIDEFKIWDGERTQTEIQANMFLEAEGINGLSLYYNFENGIPNGDNSTLELAGGTIFNMPRTTSISNWVAAQPLVCKSCQPELTFGASTGELNGHYKASERIIVNTDAQFGPDVTLDAPLVEVNFENEATENKDLYIVTDGCIGCDNMAAADYCANSSDFATYEWIESFEFGTFTNNNSGASNYSDFTSLTISPVQSGQTILAMLSPGYINTAYSEHFSIWIDFNFDGTFDSTELVWTSSGNVPMGGSIQIPTLTKFGNTIMRVQMSFDNIGTSCGSYTFGETEDYKITLSDGSGLCE